MTPKQATRILYKMSRVLDDFDDLRISIDRTIEEHGKVTFYASKPAQLKLNPSRRGVGGIVSTLIHELLHVVYFNAPESRIRKLEKEVYENLTDRQLTNLLKRMWLCLK